MKVHIEYVGTIFENIYKMSEGMSVCLVSDYNNSGLFVIQYCNLYVDCIYLRQANVGSVMDQMDTLMILKDRFEADMKEHGPEPTVKVENAIQGSSVA